MSVYTKDMRNLKRDEEELEARDTLEEDKMMKKRGSEVVHAKRNVSHAHDHLKYRRSLHGRSRLQV